MKNLLELLLTLVVAVGMFTGLFLFIAGIALAVASPLILIIWLILQAI